MNIKDFFEHFILRDILAFILPGSISLAGIYMAINSSGFEGVGQILPLLSGLDATSLALFLITSFLVGHLWDAVYRKLFQTNETFHRAGITKKMLIEDDHIASQIRSAVGQFINIDDWKKESGKWTSEKAHELSVLLSYWIEEEDPKIYNDEIARPHIQSHFLHACGMASCFFGVCVLLGESIWQHELVFVKASLPMLLLVLFAVPVGLAVILQSQHKRKILMAFFVLGVCVLLGEIIWKPELIFIKMWLSVLFTILFGLALIAQGQHKRKILVEHVFRVFYVIWQKRVLAHKDALEIARRW